MVSSLDLADVGTLVMVMTVPICMMVSVARVFVNVRDFFGGDVIMRVSVVRDEGAACLIASELDLICVDLMERGSHRVITNLDHGAVRRHSSSGQLGVHISGRLYVSSSHVQLHSMCAFRFLVSIRVAVRVTVILLVMLGIRIINASVRFLVRLLDRGLVIVVMIGAAARLLRTARIAASARGRDVPGELGLGAGEELRARFGHLRRKGKLLAEEHQSISVLVQILLLIAANAHNMIHCARARDHLLIVIFHKLPDIGIIFDLNVDLGVLDPILDDVGIIDEVSDRSLEGFEGDHYLSLLLCSLLIIILIPNLPVLSESIHLSVKIGSWQSLAVFLLIISLSMSLSNIKAWLAIEVIVKRQLLSLNIESASDRGE